jgi:hypothetical protein
VLAYEGFDRAGRRGDPADRDEQRLLQHRREQLCYGFPGLVGHMVLLISFTRREK